MNVDAELDLDTGLILCAASYGDRGPRIGVRDMDGPARFARCHRIDGHPPYSADHIGHSDQPEHFGQ